MKRQDIERVLAAIEGELADIDVTHPRRTSDRITAAVRALADPEPCEHLRATLDPDDEDGEHLVCPDCGETGCIKPCGICSSRFCRCSEYGLR